MNEKQFTNKPVVSVIKIGTIIEGSGVSERAQVLLCKPVQGMPHCTIVMCFAPKSVYHPYVVWTYNETTGSCNSGDYYRTMSEAAIKFGKREW